MNLSALRFGLNKSEITPGCLVAHTQTEYPYGERVGNSEAKTTYRILEAPSADNFRKTYFREVNGVPVGEPRERYSLRAEMVVDPSGMGKDLIPNGRVTLGFDAATGENPELELVG